MAQIYVSPGVFTREQDFSVFASRLGITKMGLVGLTNKGPAFDAISINSTDEFMARFGGETTDKPLPYVANTFLKQSDQMQIVRVLGTEGFTNSNAWVITGSASAGTGTTLVYSGVTLAVMRSKASDADGYGTAFHATLPTDFQIGAFAGGVLGDFVVSATTGPLTAQTLTCSLDETKQNYIGRVFGRNPKSLAGDFNFYVEKVYPHFIRQAGALVGGITAITATVSFENDSKFTDYSDQYVNSVSPYVVSELQAGQARQLFRVQTISDGNASAREVKISITNIDTVNKTFDVLVRNFADTDATAFSTAIERWRTCTMDKTKVNYVARVIGTTDEEYPINSKYVTLDMVEGHPTDVIPGGFEGYSVTTESGATIAPHIFYKENYQSDDVTLKTFLGVSELGYTGFTIDLVGSRNVINSVETDIFKYQGAQSSGRTTIRGFHMQSGADTTAFTVGIQSTISAYTKNERKFTFLPAGGTDGFRPWRTPTFTVVTNDATNLANFKTAIDEFANPEEVDVNLFATPGVNYADNTNLIRHALSMVEDRADALYIVDAPRGNTGTIAGSPEQAVTELQNTGIDSNYAATYWPWVQIEDITTGAYVWVSPTLEVVKAIALTDNVAFPWFAPAGFNRAVTNVKKAEVKLTKAQRDTLYDDRINPIATFTQGVVIWGQKTMQTVQSALDRINVRRLLIQVRRLIAAASQTLVFEQNDATLRDQFLQRVEPILLQIQNNRGLTAFNIVMDESNNTPDVIDRNMLVGKIQLKPTRTAEFIELTFQVLPTGANFEDF